MSPMKTMMITAEDARLMHPLLITSIRELERLQASVTVALPITTRLLEQTRKLEQQISNFLAEVVT